MQASHGKHPDDLADLHPAIQPHHDYRLLQQQLGDAEQEREWLLARWQKDQSGVARPVWELDFQWG